MWIALGLAWAQVLEVEELTLDNGMEFLLLPRDDQPLNVSLGWVAHVGSVDERPGITGISHFFEHMMFKGTTTVGTRDPEKERWYRLEQEKVHEKLRALQLERNYPRYQRGAIDDPWHPSNDDDEMKALRAELDQLVQDHAQVIVADEFDQLYAELGGTAMNAFTGEDLTFYFVTMPANKVEHWAWMESDRLADSVFREFYPERDVVHEERRMRTESTPTGIFDEQYDAMFFQSSPYSWPVIGWPSDLNAYTQAQARDYFATYYAPNNLTGVVVGDFDPEVVKPLLSRYFGRLERGPEPPPVVTLEMDQRAEKRMVARCECTPQLKTSYHTPAYVGADAPVVEVIARLLSGRTGRLHRAMVEGAEVASATRARHDSRKYAGALTITLETKGDATPADLERVLEQELQRLKDEPVSDAELERVRNHQQAELYRTMGDNYELMVNLGYYHNRSHWKDLFSEVDAIAGVTAADVQRVATELLVPHNRIVAHYLREEGE